MGGEQHHPLAVAARDLHRGQLRVARVDQFMRGLEPALSYDFTANPVVCNISEGLMMFTPDQLADTSVTLKELVANAAA